MKRDRQREAEIEAEALARIEAEQERNRQIGLRQLALGTAIETSRDAADFADTIRLLQRATVIHAFLTGETRH